MKTSTLETPVLSALQSDVLQSVVHDLRTPMTVIKGYIQLLLNGNAGSMSSDQMQLLQRSVGPLEDLIQLTDNLMQSISLQRDQVEVSFAPVDLDRLLAETIEFYQLPFLQR